MGYASLVTKERCVSGDGALTSNREETKNGIKKPTELKQKAEEIYNEEAYRDLKKSLSRIWTRLL